jgi:ethanolamine ammonia-lyase large subunit
LSYAHTLGQVRYTFADLKTLFARASAQRSGDQLAQVAAATERERVAAKLAIADLPMSHFLDHHVIPYEIDDVTRLIVDTHDQHAFAPIRHLTVGDFRNWLLATSTTTAMLTAAAPGVTPEMASAVCRLMQNQDLITVAKKCSVITRFRTTIGLPGRLAIRLQPNHPTDDARGVAASMLDGLFYGCGDAVIGVNPAKENVATVTRLLRMMDDFRVGYDVPMQSCVLAHITTTLAAINAGAPVDLVFQSIGGTQATNESFGISLAMLREGYEAGLSLHRGATFADGSTGSNVMYFETGQGSSLSANAHHGVDQQTCEARAYAIARQYHPLLVNSVVGFIGPEYLYDGRQVIRAGLEDHFCGKLLGLPMGCDVCYTNHAEVDQNDMDTLLTLLGVAGVNFVMGVPGADDVMLGYQSTSFHDALYLRQALGLKRAPEFEAWLEHMGITDATGALRTDSTSKLSTYQAQIAASFADEKLSTINYELATPTHTSARSAIVSTNSWQQLQQFTHARIALGRAGNSLPTESALAFALAHAEARDAVHYTLDLDALMATLGSADLRPILVNSNAPDRTTYLQQPSMGRTLAPASRAHLAESRETGQAPLVFVIADGLCPLAIERHALALILSFQLQAPAWKLGPVVVATQARVALGDDIGEALGATAVAVLIGERPGLSSPDSLGIYLTWNPRQGLTDAERNCISNIHAQGMSPEQAATKLAALLDSARMLDATGTLLHDEVDDSNEAGLSALTNPENVTKGITGAS